MDKHGAYEFTIRFILNIHEYYHAHNLMVNTDDGKFVDENLAIYQIFNYHNINNHQNKNENGVNEDLKDVDNENLDESHQDLDSPLVKEPPKNTVPEVIKALYNKMTYETFQDKLKNPNWLYKDVFL